MDEFGWQIQKSRKSRKSNNPIDNRSQLAISTEIRSLNRSFGARNVDSRANNVSFESHVAMKGNINKWVRFAYSGNIEKIIDERIESLSFVIDGRLERLWDCVFGRLAMVIPERMKGYMSGFDLRDEAFLKIKEDDQSDDTAIEYICERFHLELRIICLDSQIKDICYGKNNQPSFVILHAGFDYFLPLKPRTTVYKNLFTAEEKKSVNNLNQIQEKRANRSNLVADRKLLDEISKRLRGMAKAQEIDEFYSSKAQRKNAKEKALCYDIYSPVQLDKMENLIICKLKLLNAHSGVANPLERTSEMKYKRIKLNSRRNCGFNAFCDDVVYVKINDSVNHTGKVMGVHESTHKPVNNFYICKVSRDQGTLMIPINNFFPKIHVDNEPGRRKYEQDIQDIKGNRRIRDEQKSVVDREKESRNYADNIYYSLYKLSNNKSNNTIHFNNYQKVVKFNPETCENFFIVIYERWDPHFMYPTGKIIGVLSTYDTLDDNFHLISSICNVTAFENTAQIVKEIHEIENKSKCSVTNNYIPPGAMVFTIDNETTTDMDDAISYHKEGNDIFIGVHISDVTKYISSTHQLYRQALNRFCTTYPPKFCHISPVHLFGDKLSTDVLSLVPNKPRAVMSVFFKFTEKMLSKDFQLDEIIIPKFSEGVIMSKHKLNYESVTCWLKQTECPSDCPSKELFIALKETYEIARKLRRARLPESYFVRSTNEYLKDFDIKNQFEGEMLIEELMLLANEYVAKKIYERYPENTLLRMQNKVNDHEEWIEELFRLTNMNFTARLKEYCNLLNVNISDSGKMRGLVVSRRFYDKFSEFLSKEETVEKARNLLQYDDFYNDFYVHITKWYKLSFPARYICSIKDSVDNGHFSLAKPLYTHFTSPIRRFTDVIVHRLLKSVINGTEITDSSLDIHEVCDIANTRGRDNRTFEKLCAPYAIFNETDRKNCFILDCVCGEINNTEIKLVHPMLQKAASEKTVKFSDLSLDEAPLSLSPDQIAEKCILKWRKIIFTCLTENFESSESNKFQIDNHLFDCKLLNSYWKLFRKIRRSYTSSEELKDELIELQSKFKPSSYDQVISSDSISISNPIIDIELEIFVKNTMRIQFCKYQMNGLQKISPELYIVTPTFEICMIHKNDPVRFFIPGGKLELKHNDIKKRFSKIEEYKEYFKPLIHVESLSETLGENPAFTLLKVPIKWIVCRTKNKYKQRYGVIMLSYGFCKTRNIIFNDENDKIIDRYEYLIDEGIDSVGGDLLCLRYRKKGWENYWVGHGEIVHVGKCKIMSDIFKVIVFRLTQWDFEWFTNEADDTNYSVDVYMKSVVSKRQEEAVDSIDKHSLLKEVILGINVFSEMIDSNLIDNIQKEIEGKKNFKFNYNQKLAMENAMNQKLSLIWGPPGTGKTHIGCILSYAFKLKNELRAQNGVVLYCGPSNDCVNLVAVEMKKKLIDNSPKILRIFGEQQELVDFPLPGFLSKNNTQLTEEMKEISLHHLIRQTGNTYADALRKYDTKFNDILNNPRQGRRGEETREEIHSSILAYKETLKEAKLELIKKHHFEMVLCTTSVTATNIMQNFNIVQVIIDEAGMCKEPETLIPISSTEKTVENVVLIGDHKQLRPIIHSKIANKRGLQISLFERYQELRPGLVTMLNYQYRMHPSICEFPSRQFYNGRLITQISNLWSGLQPENVKCNYTFWNGIDYEKCKYYYESILTQTGYNAIPNEQWPGCRNVPYKCFHKYFSWYPERLVFINVIGDEVIQSVSTATGNENSRGNYLEVEAVGHIYQKIIEGFPYPRLAPEHITVLTQYKLQQFLLQKKCKDILSSKRIKCAPLVKTVIRSQGSESDYIIFSTVRSLRNKEDINDRPTPGWEKQYLGFITDPNQINVALTRAKKGLIIIGNKNLLRVNGIWKKLINDLEIRNCVIDSYLDFLR